MSSLTFELTLGSHNLCKRSFNDLAISAGDFWRPLPPKRKAMWLNSAWRTAPLCESGRYHSNIDIELCNDDRAQPEAVL